MHGPYGFELNQSCRTCTLKTNGFFCQLPPSALKDLDAVKFTSAYPQDAVLFLEKQAPRGIYVLCEGQVKLSISSSEGKRLILRIAKPGEVLGLMAAMSGNAHEVTAETLRPCKVTFIPRDSFLRFLAQHPEAYPAIAVQLGSHYQIACEQIRTLGLSASVTEKLAKLLLEWSAGAAQTNAGTRTRLPLTHEEIAEFIGTTRESVTRTLSELKNRHLVVLEGSTLTIPNRAALESCVSA
jgi:CRP/FNR family transcriptional regulator, cyclic AMP receptor protein